MAVEDSLDLLGVNVDAAADDHVLLPVDDVVVAFVVPAREIARRHPALAETVGRFPGLLPVTAKQVGRTAEQLAHLAVANRVARVVE